MGDLFQPWHLLVLLVVALFLVVPWIFYILTLRGTLNKCALSSRVLSPDLTWLLLIPLVSLVMQFIIVIGMAQTLFNEFTRRGALLPEPRPGQATGIAMAVCGACSIVPIPALCMIAAMAHLILWIIYWGKIADYSRLLDMTAHTPLANPANP